VVALHEARRGDGPPSVPL